jgi:hypothetical protein
MPAFTRDDQDPPVGTPMIIAETDSYITIAFEVPKASLRRHARFVEQLAALARRDGD